MHRSTAELESLLDLILAAPKDGGRVEMIVRRPAVGAREILEEGLLDPELGLVGDNWAERLGGDGRPSRHAQVTMMNARVSDAVAVTRDRWALAGDQLHVDLDLSPANLPAGTRLRVGEAVLEVSEVPHTGCAKFAARYGKDALRFANLGTGRENRFRGVNLFVVEGGMVRVGDGVSKL